MNYHGTGLCRSQRAMHVVFRCVVTTLPQELRNAITSNGLDDLGLLFVFPRSTDEELHARGLDTNTAIPRHSSLLDGLSLRLSPHPSLLLQ